MKLKNKIILLFIFLLLGSKINAQYRIFNTVTSCGEKECCAKYIKKNCYLDNYTVAFNKDYTKLDTFRFVKRTLKGKEFKEVNSGRSKYQSKITHLYGVSTMDFNLILPTAYRSFGAISSTTFWVTPKDGIGTYLIDVEKGTKIKSPYIRIFHDATHLTFGVKKIRENENYDVVVIRPDLSESPVIENVNYDYDIQLVNNRILYVNNEIDEERNYVTNIYNIAGELLENRRRIDAFIPGPKRVSKASIEDWEKNMELRGEEKVYAERICKSPIQIFGDDYLYHPLDKKGAPMELPNDVIGIIPMVARHHFVNGWVLVSKNEDTYTYRIGKGRPEIVFAKYDELEVLEDFLITELKYSFPKATSGFLYYPHSENDWLWGDWERVLIAKTLKKEEYKVIKSLFNPNLKRTDSIYGTSYFEAKLALTEERELSFAKYLKKVQQERIAKQEQQQKNKAYLVNSFEKDFGTNDPVKIGWLNSKARELGGDYFRRFIMRYHPFSYADVQLACAIDYTACQKAQQYWNNQKANDAYKAYQEVQSRAKSKYEGEVRVLIIDKGTMRQEVYSKSHYNKYYKN